MINTSDYNKAGIFIEEINNSVIDTPAAQEAVVNFIPGFSRKGTVFNRPVLVKTKTERATYFGDIDRVLEKKGDFFHRTVDVAIQTAPVWALNLLKTTSLDVLNYASVSLSAQYDNDDVATEEYDSFFNKSGFWQRDTESFLNFAQDSEKMLHLTNVSDKKITVFMFKSKLAGFDVTAETWYGGATKVPTWIRPTDLMSDYMVRVVVVANDWSSYVSLAADNNYSKYFTTSGLRKEKVDSFIKDANVTLLGDYNGSLIPYFRDSKNQNIFIETLINLDTDKTGLFASYDIDNVETDFPNGNVDVIGQSLVDNTRQKIKFMSYSETIEEKDSFDATALNSLGNVIGVGSALVNKKNGWVTTTAATLGGSFTTVVAPSITYSAGSCIINNTTVTIAGGVVNFTALPAPVTTTMYRIDMVYIDSTGALNLVEGTAVELANSLAESAAVTAGLTYPASYPNNAIVAAYVFRTRTTAPVYANTHVPVSITTTGFVDLTISSTPSGTLDILVTTTSINNVTLTFNGTATATKANYAAYRRLQFFNELASKKVLSTSVIRTQAPSTTPSKKVDLAAATWADNYSSGTGDKFVTITVAAGLDIATEPATGNKFTFYYVDNEFVMGTIGLETLNDYTLATTNYGIVAKNSEMYGDFYDGVIKTGDHFFVKQAVTTTMKFVHYTNTANPTAVGDYIILNTTTDSAAITALGIAVGNLNSHILIQDHAVNANDYVISRAEVYNTGGGLFGPALYAGGYLTTGEIAIKVNNTVTTYSTLSTIDVYNYNLKVYLKMYRLGSNMKAIFYSDNALTAPYTIPGGLTAINTSINIFSGEASYNQTVEIENHASYTITDTKFLIDLARYPEVKVGDYIKAHVDTEDLQPGEFAKKFTRIIKKTPWSGNTTYSVSYAEITTDSKYHVDDFGGDLQTERYTTIEDYVDTYKAIALAGFVPQAASIPDGTETRQSEILDIIGTGTNLFNAIVNKNKFNFRYLIDCWGNGLTEFSKQQLVDICGKRKNCLGFINMPSAKAFKNSSSPSFTNEDGTLNLNFVRNGGDLESNPSFLYSFATGEGTTDGRPAVGYFFPYVTVNDNGRPLAFPPAAYVANTYMRKLNSTIAGIYNWTVAAGSEDGKILGIANVEMDFNDEALIELYAMGANPLVYAKNKGFYIESEWTALRTPLSSLSYLHAREVLIDLENDLYAMLLKYQWKFNTAANRAKIKREADEICQKYVDRSGLYAYRNVIDETNNTPELIDNQFGLLETYVEITKAMGVIVNKINVMATGALGNSTGFTA
jgi:hypothetical protein